MPKARLIENAKPLAPEKYRRELARLRSIVTTHADPLVTGQSLVKIADHRQRRLLQARHIGRHAPQHRRHRVGQRAFLGALDQILKEQTFIGKGGVGDGRGIWGSSWTAQCESRSTPAEDSKTTPAFCTSR